MANKRLVTRLLMMLIQVKDLNDCDKVIFEIKCSKIYSKYDFILS